MKKLNKVFVYGTLLSGWTRDSLGVSAIDIKSATLYNYEKRGLNVKAKKGGKVAGIVFDVNDADLAKLDAYEGLPNLYHRMEVDVKVGYKKEVAHVYQLNTGNK